VRLVAWLRGLGLEPRLIGLVLVVLVPLTALQAIRIFESVAEAKRAALQANLEMANAVRVASSAYLETLTQHGSSLGQEILNMVADRGLGAVRQLLLDELPGSATVLHYHWVSPAGWVISSTLPGGSGQYLGNQDYVLRVLQEHRTVVSDLLPPEGNMPITFVVAQPIWRGSSMEGALLTVVDPDRLGTVLDVDRHGSGRIGLTDRAGRVIFRSGVPLEELSWERRQLPRGPQYPTTGALAGEVRTSERFTGVFDTAARMGAAVPVVPVGWVAYATTDLAEVLGSVTGRARRDTVILLLVATLAFGWAWWIARSTSYPLEELRQVAGGIMRGENGALVKQTGYGEVADAVQAFNSMTAHINRVEEELRTMAAGRAMMLESTTDSFFALDHEWRFVYVNQNAERSLRRRREELLGRSYWEEFPKVIGSVFETEYRRALSEGRSVEFEAYCHVADSWQEVHAHPYPNGLAVFFRDVSERRAAAMALAAESRARELERQRLSTVLKILPVGVMITGDAGEVVQMNEECERIWGGQPGSELGRVLRDGQFTLNEEIEIDAHDGEHRTILHSAVPLRNEAGEIAGAVVVNVDITRQKLLEAQMRRHAARIDRKRAVLQRIAEGAPLEEVLQQIAANVVLSAGASAAEVVLLHEDGRSWRTSTNADGHLEPPPRGGWSIPIRIRAGRTVGGLTLYFARSGAPSTEELTAAENNARLAAIAVERHEHEVGRAQKLENLVENMSEGVVALTAEGIITINHAARRLLDLPPGAPINERIQHLPAGLGRILEQTAGEGGTDPTRVLLPIGETEVEVNVRPVYTAMGRYGTLAILQDVTARARFERLQRSFVANVSHELRGPLASVSATLEAVADGLIPHEEQQRYLRSVLQEMARLRRLSYEVVEMTQIDAGLLQPKQEVIDLHALIQRVVDTYAQRASEAGVALELEPGADSSARLAIGDQDRVMQVITNLVDNAVRYTAAGGRVRVRTQREGEQVRTLVSDTGCGIPKEHLPLIWERFYKADPARTFSPGSGTGIGLAIVREMVALMGGRVAVQSEFGKGSVFSFTLPTEPSPVLEAAAG